MPDIRQILNKCDIKGHGFLHDYVQEIDLRKNTVKIGLSHDLLHQLDAAITKKSFKRGIVFLVIDPDEFNQAMDDLQNKN